MAKLYIERGVFRTFRDIKADVCTEPAGDEEIIQRRVELVFAPDDQHPLAGGEAIGVISVQSIHEEGRFDESVARARELLTISPFSAMHSVPLPGHLYMARRIDEAITAARAMPLTKYLVIRMG